MPVADDTVGSIENQFSVAMLLALIASVLGLVSALPYLVSILRGITKPSRTTYLIWLVIDTINLMTLIYIGGGGGVPLQLILTVQGLLWVALSVKYGVWAPNLVDLLVAVIAVAALSVWFFIGAGAALLTSITALAAGYISTLAKLITHPLSESLLSWLLVAAAASLSIVSTALTNLSLPAIALPTMTLLGSLAISVVTINQRRRNTS